MKKIMATVLLVVFAVFVGRRLYIRDPFGVLTRNGVREVGAKVFVNAIGDVILTNDTPYYLTVVQHGGNRGQPRHVHCIRSVACLFRNNVVDLNTEVALAVDSMSSKAVVMHEGTLKLVVALR